MALALWIIVFIVSLAVLIKSADYFTESAEKIGLALGMSPFLIGITIVSIGTSLPELAGGIAAVIKGSNEIVVANAIGSNIANILLIVGIASIAAGTLIVKRSLIDIDLPLLALVTSLITVIIWDKEVVWQEAILMFVAYGVYIAYIITSREEGDRKKLIEEEILEELPLRADRRSQKVIKEATKFSLTTILILIGGVVGLYLGANYIIEAVIKITELAGISTSVIAITAIAVGTSLPELAVSVKAAIAKKHEIALGNIFGSNIFNALIVIGIPTFIGKITVDDVTFRIGIPFLILSTVLFIFSGISKKIHQWEGAMYLIIYIVFLAKLFNFF